ncbi:MAG: endonuclease/exonuclease/phosphatase family protein [Candidatus Saccharimonadales bacterium]
MSLDVLAWNAQECLGKPDLRDEIYEQLRQTVADSAGVIVLSEACRERPMPIDEVAGELEQFASIYGFQLCLAGYQDAERPAGVPKNYEKYLAVLSRLEQASGSIFRLAGRNAVELSGRHEAADITLIGAHYDHRSESRRLPQAQASLVEFDNHQDSIAILAGDLNAMHGQGARAKLLKATRPVTRLIGANEVKESSRPDDMTSIKGVEYKFRRAASCAYRVGEMAAGETMRLLEGAGFNDADLEHKPTHLGGKLDHIMYRGGVRLEDFRMGEKFPSDHKFIVATLAIT